MKNPIWVTEPQGVQIRYPTLPNCWDGELECVVGPFSSESVAQYFTQAAMEHCRYDAVMDHIFAKGDAWYVEVKSLANVYSEITTTLSA